MDENEKQAETSEDQHGIAFIGSLDSKTGRVKSIHGKPTQGVSYQAELRELVEKAEAHRRRKQLLIND